MHGAWADGSCWAKVIPLMHDKGLNVTAAQIPLNSLDDDIAVTKRILGMLDAPVVLVGHSYGGAAITGAARGTNQRRDDYGGAKENRARLLFDIVSSVSAEIGAERLAVRLSPFGRYGGIYDSNQLELSCQGAFVRRRKQVCFDAK
jgi:hypothetical protein